MTDFLSLPWSVEYKGKVYKLTPTHDCVLRMYRAIEGFDYAAQVEIALHYLIDGKHPVSQELLDAVSKVLFTEGKSTTKVFDFVQDAELIYAAFMQAYHIDLCDEKLHWWKFGALLNGMPSDTRFSEVVRIRAMEIPKPTPHNHEERMRIIRLKPDYALKQTAEERELGVSNEAITYGWKKPIVVTDVPEEFVEELKKNKEDAR